MNINWEELAKRMMGLSAIGGTIEHFSGHRYIHFSESCGGYFNMYDICKKHGVEPPRSKCYGGIIVALDRVDEVLKKVGHSSLLETFEAYDKDCSEGYEKDPNYLILLEDFNG